MRIFVGGKEVVEQPRAYYTFHIEPRLVPEAGFEIPISMAKAYNHVTEFHRKAYLKHHEQSGNLDWQWDIGLYLEVAAATTEEEIALYLAFGSVVQEYVDELTDEQLGDIPDYPPLLVRVDPDMTETNA